MNTSDDQWWHAQAGEYVLGTLRDTERDVFKKILLTDPETQQKVSYWQRRLSELDASLAPVQPPDNALPALMSRVRGISARTDTLAFQDSPDDTAKPSKNRRSRARSRSESDVSSGDQPPSENRAYIYRKRSRTTFEQYEKSQKEILTWKGVAGLAVAATVCMAALLVQSTKQDVPENTEVDAAEVVSVVQDKELYALWVLTAQEEEGSLKAVALSPPPIDNNQSYQLWMFKPNDKGVSSVGLLPKQTGEAAELTMKIPTREAQLFAVSVEPEGGSPNSKPTGPVLFTGTITNVDSPAHTPL